MGKVIPLTHPRDADRVLHLCLRARDYVTLETGKGPDAAYVHVAMTDAPPGVPAHQVWCWGHQNAQGTLDGLATCLKGFYAPDDWYLGLLLLDPSARGAGLGTRMARHVMDLARADAAPCLRIAVLDANPRARAFWETLGFCHEKSTWDGDGSLRHVLRHSLHDTQ